VLGGGVGAAEAAGVEADSTVAVVAGNCSGFNSHGRPRRIGRPLPFAD